MVEFFLHFFLFNRSRDATFESCSDFLEYSTMNIYLCDFGQKGCDLPLT
jgi:hypothetical protein